MFVTVEIIWSNRESVKEERQTWLKGCIWGWKCGCVGVWCGGGHCSPTLLGSLDKAISLSAVDNQCRQWHMVKRFDLFAVERGRDEARVASSRASQCLAVRQRVVHFHSPSGAETCVAAIRNPFPSPCHSPGDRKTQKGYQMSGCFSPPLSDKEIKLSLLWHLRSQL